jgi:hypothetical protein
MAKPTITVNLTNTEVFQSVIGALQAAYKFIDIIFEMQDVDYAISTKHYDNYLESRKKLENGNQLHKTKR